MDFTFLGEVLTPERADKLRHKLLCRLTTHFFPDRMDSIPISCRIKPMQQGSQLNKAWFEKADSVVVYMENYEVMVRSTANTVLRFLNTREPWQDFDVCIFPEDVTWCAALTHNDEAKFVSLGQ